MTSFDDVVDLLVKWTEKVFIAPVWILTSILPITPDAAMDLIGISFIAAYMIF